MILYYEDVEGNLFADPLKTEGLVEVVSPVRQNGEVLLEHKNIDLLQKDDDGLYYDYYINERDESGFYQPDLNKINESNYEASLALWKVQRDERVANIEVTYNGVIYQGDENSQNRISRAIIRLEETQEVAWLAKDNSVQMLLPADLKIILSGAGAQQDFIWHDGRPIEGA